MIGGPKLNLHPRSVSLGSPLTAVSDGQACQVLTYCGGIPIVRVSMNAALADVVANVPINSYCNGHRSHAHRVHPPTRRTIPGPMAGPWDGAERPGCGRCRRYLPHGEHGQRGASTGSLCKVSPRGHPLFWAHSAGRGMPWSCIYVARRTSVKAILFNCTVLSCMNKVDSLIALCYPA